MKSSKHFNEVINDRLTYIQLSEMHKVANENNDKVEKIGQAYDEQKESTNSEDDDDFFGRNQGKAREESELLASDKISSYSSDSEGELRGRSKM